MEEMNYTVETMEEENVGAACPVKSWLNNTLYEAGRLLQAHKKVIVTIAAVAAGVAAVITAICLLTKKK